MRKFLNTLFITNSDIYLGVEGENILVKEDGELRARFPLHNLESITIFNYSGISPHTMRKCMENGIGINFLSETGYYLGTVSGYPNGNVILRKKQALMSEDAEQCLKIAQVTIFSKLYNQKYIVERFIRQYSLRLSVSRFEEVSTKLSEFALQAVEAKTLEQIRGIEGTAQVLYFSLFDEMVLTNKEIFRYNGRSRRPPADPLNACLSLAYTLLAIDMKNALTSVGLDPYIGFFHTDRPGRISLALDMIEELRGVLADRFVLSLINRGQLTDKDFVNMESGAVLLSDDSRKKFLKEWHSYKQESITHPYLREKFKWGLVPYSQALLLARYIRGDLDAYPGFCWK
ncbi:MAG: type I-C CRISPR-associated endonuclease Cas1 [Ruminococcaceae bacterium]|nr:type I-C CRISPR-associated endonuclease Cas1 [Oscillospiraceae bacterium]